MSSSDRSSISTPHDWLKKLAPIFHPIRSKTPTNCNSLGLGFPRFSLQVLIASLDCLCPLWLARLITFVLVYDGGTHLKTVLMGYNVV